MADANPFAAPDDARLAAETSARPDPEAVEARFEGTGRGTEQWRLHVTEARLFFELMGEEVSFTLSRDDVAERMNLGTLSRKTAMLVLRAPDSRALRMPRAALDHIYGWLGDEAQARFRARLMRNGWGSTLAVGLVFLIPTDLPAIAYGLGVAAGAILVAAALISRFTAARAGLLLRALGWGLLAVQMTHGVLNEGRSPWLLAICGLLLWGVLRYVRLFGLLRPRGAQGV